MQISRGQISQTFIVRSRTFSKPRGVSRHWVDLVCEGRLGSIFAAVAIVKFQSDHFGIQIHDVKSYNATYYIKPFYMVSNFADINNAKKR